MSLNFIEEKNRDTWDKFVIENDGDFLQSWVWGDLQKTEGVDICRFFISSNNESIGCFQAHKQITRLGDYWYIPHGPVFKKNKQKYFNREFVCELGLFFKKTFSESFFILYESLDFLVLPQSYPFDNLQPKHTLIIDLERPIEEIWQDIAYSRRQGINFSQKRGVKVFNSKSIEFLDLFYVLMQRTSLRQKFRIFNKGHYKNIYDLLPCEIFIAKQDEGGALVASEVIFWNNTAVYLHTGSSDIDKKLRAPDLLIWKIIEESKKRGFKKLDLWGIDAKRWPGVSVFKKSFGGIEAEYPKARVIINNKLKFLIYILYKKVFKIFKK